MKILKFISYILIMLLLNIVLLPIIHIRNEFLFLISPLAFVFTFLLFFKKIKITTNKDLFWKDILLKSGILFILNMLVSIIIPIIAQGDNSQKDFLFPLLKDNNFFFIIIIVSIITPFVEELFFREGLLRIIENEKVFLIVSSVTFALLHITKTNSIFNLLITLLSIGIQGFFNALFFIRYKDLRIPIFTHFLNNFIAIFILFYN